MNQQTCLEERLISRLSLAKEIVSNGYQNGYNKTIPVNAGNIIYRDYNRTEKDDFSLNVSHQLSELKEAMPLYCPEGRVIGWKVINRYD